MNAITMAPVLKYLEQDWTLTLGAAWGLVATGVYVLGLLHALHAIMRVRLSQSAIAWSVFLVSMPWLAIPVYWIFGRRKFEGYTNLMRLVKTRYEGDRRDILQFLSPFASELPDPLQVLDGAAKKLGFFPFTSHNQSRLLLNGEETFDSILQSLSEATDYILFQVYIFRQDSTGDRFLDALMDAAKRGVRVYLLFDEVGSSGLGNSFFSKAQAAGILTSGFRTTKGPGNRLQLNFRNHRKVIVVDGVTGFIGGLNIGDEYLGLDPDTGPWRDTHLRVCGPAVKGLQFSFVNDWHWATDSIPEVSWDFRRLPVQKEGERAGKNLSPNEADGCDVLILPTGPNDERDACTLFVGTLIDLAKTRLWIASPYFVPDDATLTSLKIAALRGVDVRILLPERQDHKVMKWCAWSYYEELKNHGVNILEYRPGFMHQKVILIDNLVAGVGTVNLDNRSFKLNFEIMAYIRGEPFLQNVERMFRDDFSRSAPAALDIVASKPLPMRILVKITRLFSAVL